LIIAFAALFAVPVDVSLNRLMVLRVEPQGFS
jgi:hypothetical protein